MADIKIIFPRPTIRCDSGCIEIDYPDNRQVNPEDYPSANYNGKRWGAHRLSYNLNVTDIPRLAGSKTDGWVLHTCDNKHCVNPEHLYLGTARQNVHDTYNRHPTIRQKISESISALPRSQNFKFDWTGKQLSQKTKATISEKARKRYANMTKEQRQAHMQPALEKRWS